MKLAGKIALITGSARRVGRTIAETLANKGAKVVIQYRNSKTDAEDTVKKIKKGGGKAILVQGDISGRNDWLAMRDRILSEWGTIDILVNNAAIFHKTPFLQLEESEWNQFLDVNLKGTFLGCRIIGELMYERKQGKIINISDVAAESVWRDYIPYCVSKAGVIALTKGLAKALAPYVTVNSVAPGTVLLAEDYDEKEEQNLIRRTPLNRIGSPEDIAKTVLFLITGSDFINGEVIKVDGGRSIN